MKVTEYFQHAHGKTLVSFEVLPPLKGGGLEAIFKILDPLMEFKPPFIDVTYHREEFIYKKHPTGYYEKTAIRKRPGTVGICAAIMHHYGVDAVPHLICGGFSKEETENALIDLHFLNIKNVLALRGDAHSSESTFIPDPKGHAYAIELVQQLQRMNQGQYLDENIVSGNSTDFCIGVAGYPEKHFECPNLDTDIQHLAAKVKAGADYIVTQMFFDNTAFLSFVDKCRAAGIQVPIIPGLKPVTKKYQLTSIPRNFYVNFPSELTTALHLAKDDQAVKDIGIEWCIQQSKELMKFGVPCLHYYTMGDANTTRRVIEKIL